MRTGIFGEIKGAPAESLVFYSKEAGITIDQRVTIRKIVQEKIYFEAILEELYQHFPEELFKNYVKKYSPHGRKHVFTDDTVLTIASMDGILELIEKGTGHLNLDAFFAEKYHTWANKYPEAGFGGQFREWMGRSDMKAYYSMGNGSAMRTAPFGYMPDEIFYALLAARHASCATHDHPEGIRGALAVTHAVITARNKVKSKDIITDNVEGHYYYDLHRKLADIRPTYKFEVLAHKSVPEAIIAFLESSDHITAVENAISLGGDTDTQAMIAGSIADAFYGYETIPQIVHDTVEKSLPKEMMHVLEKFEKRFVIAQ